MKCQKSHDQDQGYSMQRKVIEICSCTDRKDAHRSFHGYHLRVFIWFLSNFESSFTPRTTFKITEVCISIDEEGKDANDEYIFAGFFELL